MGTAGVVAVAGRSDRRFVRASGYQAAGLLARAALRRRLRRSVEFEEIPEHPLLDLLAEPNPALSGHDTWYVTQLCVDLVGVAYLAKERAASGEVVGLWPIPPGWVVATPWSPGSGDMWQIRMNGQALELPPADVMRFSSPHPADPYKRAAGMGSVLSDELEADEYAAKTVKSFFLNRARPDLLIYLDGVQREQRDQLEEEWRSKTQGFWRSFVPFFTGRKVEIKELTTKFSDMELVSLRKAQRDIVVNVTGLPPEMLGIIESSNRATIQAADSIFGRWVLLPRLDGLVGTLQRALVPEFDERLILEVESPAGEDRELMLEAWKAFPHSVTVDDWREFQGLEPLPAGQGNVLLIPATYQVVAVEQELPGDGSGQTESTDLARSERVRRLAEELRAVRLRGRPN